MNKSSGTNDKMFTLSNSENSIRSSGEQLRPMGEMLIIPFLNSMNVPLQVELKGVHG